MTIFKGDDLNRIYKIRDLEITGGNIVTACAICQKKSPSNFQAALEHVEKCENCYSLLSKYLSIIKEPIPECYKDIILEIPENIECNSCGITVAVKDLVENNAKELCCPHCGTVILSYEGR